MEEHCSLQFKPLLEERHALDLALFSDQTRTSFGDRWNLVDKPDVGALAKVLVSVDFLLLVGPLWERGRVCPHCDFARIMNELELTGKTLEFLAWLSGFNSKLKKGIVESVGEGLLHWDCREFLVRWVVWRSDVMREKHSVGNNVSESDQFVILDVVPHDIVAVERNDLPVVVGIGVWVSSNLLSLAGNSTIIVSQRVSIRVAVKISMCFLVLDLNVVVVIDGHRVRGHSVIA